MPILNKDSNTFRKLNIVIIDFKLSNLFSVAHACEYVGIDVKITSDPKDLDEADGIILPGVGAFADAMKNLDSLGLTQAIKNHIQKNKPFMGVCLGMQLLFETSTEFGEHQGLGVFKGSVKKFNNTPDTTERMRIPHIGWDKIEIKKETSLFKGFKNSDYMYFVHSYFCIPEDRDIIATTTNYEGFEFVSAVSKNNVFAVQFHPEKSGKDGPEIYRNFGKFVERCSDKKIVRD